MRKLEHFVSLRLLQAIRDASPDEVPSYLTPEHVEAIRSMDLLSRGRLSVQSAKPLAFEAIVLLGDKGDFGELGAKPKKPAKKRKAKAEEEDSAEEPAPPKKPRKARSNAKVEEENDEAK